MAQTATIFKTELVLSDMDRHYYQTHNLTLARHPSETDERMMLRLLAFTCHASELLEFGKGLSSEDEPDIWQKNYNGTTELWLDLGQPSEKRIRQACSKSEKVALYCYGDNAAKTWWQQNEKSCARLNKLSVFFIPDETASDLAKLAERNMQLQCTIQDGHIHMSNGECNIEVKLEQWQ